MNKEWETGWESEPPPPLSGWTDLARMKTCAHQVIGTNKLVEKPAFALFDDMGVGKTKQVIDAAQILYTQDVITKVVVVAPAAVRSVWFDMELGELQKHLWNVSSCRVIEYHKKRKAWDWNYDPKDKIANAIKKPLFWLITNYDFVRLSHRLKPLLEVCNDKTLLVLDESSAVKGWKTKQTEACKDLRKRCGRVILLNGTPIANNPGDLYSQGDIMDPAILNCKNWYHFRGRYGIQGGFKNRKTIRWVFLEDLQRRFKPYVLRRLKDDCLDLPKKLPSVVYSVPMSKDTWKIYKEMRDDMITWLNNADASMAQQAVVKVIRLSQITSGFLGGVLPLNPTELQQAILDATGFIEPEVREVSGEKREFFWKWFNERLVEHPDFKIIIWCRFRPELFRLEKMLRRDDRVTVGTIVGGQKKEARTEAIRMLDPRTAPKGPAAVIGIAQAGGLGLNLTAANHVMYLSNGHSLKDRLQSEDRAHRIGQTRPVSYYDVVATGPDGQKTIDHTISKSLRNKEEIANWTISAWIQEIEKEISDNGEWKQQELF